MSAALKRYITPTIFKKIEIFGPAKMAKISNINLQQILFPKIYILPMLLQQFLNELWDSQGGGGKGGKFPILPATIIL